jgi:carboxymethylenebutenolidase
MLARFGVGGTVVPGLNAHLLRSCRSHARFGVGGNVVPGLNAHLLLGSAVVATLRSGPQETSLERRALERGDVTVPVVHARPDGMPVAGIVLHPDIMGIRPLFDDMAQRLASHGFAVAMIEPFARKTEAERAAADVPTRMAWASGLDDDDVLGDLSAAADLLVVDDGVTTVGVLGFCMGGMFTLKGAATERFDRAVSFYGMVRLPAGWEGPNLHAAIDTIADACPTLAIFGSADGMIPPADIDALRDAWAGRTDCEIVVIEGAEHGFAHDPDRPVHRPDDAARLWDRALAWLSA